MHLFIHLSLSQIYFSYVFIWGLFTPYPHSLNGTLLNNAPSQLSQFDASPLLAANCCLKQSTILSLRYWKALNIILLIHLINRLILEKASVSLLVSSSPPPAADRLEAPKLESSKAKKRFKT